MQIVNIPLNTVNGKHFIRSSGELSFRKLVSGDVEIVFVERRGEQARPEELSLGSVTRDALTAVTQLA